MPNRSSPERFVNIQNQYTCEGCICSAYIHLEIYFRALSVHFHKPEVFPWNYLATLPRVHKPKLHGRLVGQPASGLNRALNADIKRQAVAKRAPPSKLDVAASLRTSGRRNQTFQDVRPPLCLLPSMTHFLYLLP